MDEPKPTSFFDPLWRRIVVLVIVVAWVAYELLVTQDRLWIMASIGMLAYGYYSLIVKWPKPGEGAKPEG